MDTTLIDQPLFLVGSVRSGTTLLRLMLDHHPEIALGHELEYVVTHVTDSGEFPSVPSYLKWLEMERAFDCRVDPNLDFLGLVNSFLRQENRECERVSYIGAAVHKDFHRLLWIWPNAKFIHLVRDPRDVARSIVDKGWAGNAYVAAMTWLKAETSWDSLLEVLPSDRAVEVCYEQLVVQPEVELERICDFLGVEFQSCMLEYTKSAIQYPKPNAKLANQWKRKALPSEIEQVEGRVGEMMKRRGYEPVVHPRPPMSSWRRRRLEFQSRVRGWQFRVREVGLRLVVTEMLARRLRLKGLERHCIQKINAIQIKRIKREAAGLISPSANLPPASKIVELSSSGAKLPE